jgi:hypothetical protein
MRNRSRGVCPFQGPVQVLGELPVGLRHHLPHDLFLVLVMAIEGRCGAADAAGQLPHGKALDPLGEVEVAGTLENSIALYAHEVNNVNKSDKGFKALQNKVTIPV